MLPAGGFPADRGFAPEVSLGRILLFNPPHPRGEGFTREGRCTQEAGIWGTQWPPLSLTTAAAMLQADGHEVRVIDCPATRMTSTDLLERIRRFHPHAAFWTLSTPTLDDDVALATTIKHVHPEIRTGVTGTHATAVPEQVLNTPDIDMVIRGEPEKTICLWTQHARGDWAAVPGLSWRDRRGGGIRHNPSRDFMPPEEIPFPAWECLDLTPYRLPLKGRPFLMVAPIRGCPYPCTFCTAALYYGRKLRKRPVGQVLAEIRRDVTRFGIRDIFFWADTFTADREYVAALCRGIKKQRIPISWTCNSRVDTVDVDLLTLMRKAGLWMISFGIESGSNSILRQCGKGITVEQSEKAVRAAHACGIRTSGHFILGLPGDSEVRMARTLDLALSLPLDIAQFYAAAPFPGTRLYDEAIHRGWLRAEDTFSQNRAVLRLPGLPPAQVTAFIAYAYRRFYSRPGTLKRLAALTEPAGLTHIWKNIGRVARLRLRGSGDRPASQKMGLKILRR